MPRVTNGKDREAKQPADLCHVVTHGALRHQDRTAVRTWSGKSVLTACLTGLPDDLGIERELGLDADLEAVERRHGHCQRNFA